MGTKGRGKSEGNDGSAARNRATWLLAGAIPRKSLARVEEEARNAVELVSKQTTSVLRWRPRSRSPGHRPLRRLSGSLSTDPSIRPEERRKRDRRETRSRTLGRRERSRSRVEETDGRKRNWKIKVSHASGSSEIAGRVGDGAGRGRDNVLAGCRVAFAMGRFIECLFGSS